MNLSAAALKALKLQFANQAKAYGIGGSELAVGQTYAATPSIAQTIYDKVVEDGNAFLQSLSLNLVDELKGDKVGMSLTGRVASRTEITGGAERTPKNLLNTDSKGYELFETEFDIAIGYKQIDQWAKFTDFANRYMTMVRRAIGNDMLQIGWAGTSVATTTVAADLSDVNIGWLQLIRVFNAGSQYLLGTTIGLAGAVTLGETDKAIGGYATLDLLAKEAKEMLPIYHQNRDDLVMLVSADVLSYQQSVFYELHGNTPSEKGQLNAAITKEYAGMPAITPAFFPSGTILVTPLENLAMYIQDSSVRRTQKDKPEKNEIQDFNSLNMGYVVEDEEMTTLVEGITFK